MTTETSNARGEWVLVPREPTPEMVEMGCNCRISPNGTTAGGVIATWNAMLAAAPPPAAAEPKTLPVPTRVHLIGETAVIVGTPGRGWDEDAQDAHNCDAMGCASIGPHVLARVPFTVERPAAQQQGQAVALPKLKRTHPSYSREEVQWVFGYNAALSDVMRLNQNTAPPPSAPVGVEAIAAEIRASLGRGATDSTRRRWAIELEALAQQPAAGAAMEFDGTDREVLREFIRICREHKPVGPWPGERVCKAIERAMDNEKPFRFIAEADMAPEREPSMKDADRMLSGPRRRRAPPPAAVEVDDTRRMNALADNYWRLEPFAMPTPGGDDADVGWRVIEFHRAEPYERVVVEHYRDNLREAIDAALAAQPQGDK